jgi:acetoin utilization deacetylase AcuC-like enzyme
MNVADNICDGRIVSILEGGYDLNALKESAYEHVKALIEN